MYGICRTEGDSLLRGLLEQHGLLEMHIHSAWVEPAVPPRYHGQHDGKHVSGVRLQLRIPKQRYQAIVC